MSCTLVAEICLVVGERKPYGADLTEFCQNSWLPGEVYELTEVLRPVPKSKGGGGANGYEYVTIQKGQTSEDEPIWPTTIDEEVTSGSAKFKCQAISNDSLQKTIDLSEWSAGIGITVEDPVEVIIDGEQKVASFFKATAKTKLVYVVNTVTFSDDHTEHFLYKVQVKE